MIPGIELEFLGASGEGAWNASMELLQSDSVSNGRNFIMESLNQHCDIIC
jgi:hypothetical protein